MSLITGVFRRAVSSGGWTVLLFGFVGTVISILLLMFMALGRFFSMFTDGPEPTPEQIEVFLGAFTVISALVLPLILLIYAGMVGSYQDVLDGREISFPGFVRNACRYFFRFLGWSILVGIPTLLILGACVFIGLALFLFGGPIGGILIIFGLFPLGTMTSAVATAAIVLSTLGRGAESWEIIWGHKWKLFGYMLLVSILGFIPGLMLAGNLLYPLYVLSWAGGGEDCTSDSTCLQG